MESHVKMGNTKKPRPKRQRVELKKLLAFHPDGRVNWKQVEENLRRFYSRQWIEKEVSTEQAAANARNIPRMIRQLKRKYYKLKKQIRDGEIDLFGREVEDV